MMDLAGSKRCEPVSFITNNVRAISGISSIAWLTSVAQLIWEMEFSKWEISKGKKENPRHQNDKFEKFPLIVQRLIFEIKHIEYLLTLSSISTGHIQVMQPRYDAGL